MQCAYAITAIVVTANHQSSQPASAETFNINQKKKKNAFIYSDKSRLHPGHGSVENEKYADYLSYATFNKNQCYMGTRNAHDIGKKNYSLLEKFFFS